MGADSGIASIVQGGIDAAEKLGDKIHVIFATISQIPSANNPLMPYWRVWFQAILCHRVPVAYALGGCRYQTQKHFLIASLVEDDGRPVR